MAISSSLTSISKFLLAFVVVLLFPFNEASAPFFLQKWFHQEQQQSAPQITLPSQASVVGPQTPEIQWTVVKTYDHDTSCFTEGLEFLTEDVMIESCGDYNMSSLVVYNVTDGYQFLKHDLAGWLFAEGITVVDDIVYQLTYQENVTLVYNLSTLEQIREFSYPREGWGIAYDQKRHVIYATDGSSNLYHLNPDDDLAEVDRVVVRCDGEPQKFLNEIEVVGSFIYVNVWKTNKILKVDPETGLCLGTINLDNLRLLYHVENVLNGIAVRPSSKDLDKKEVVLTVTGKFWKTMYDIKLHA